MSLVQAMTEKSKKSKDATVQAIPSQPQDMRAFLVIWLGELLSTVGSGLTSFALGVWIFQRTGQATPFALVVLCSYLPRVLISPIAGVLVDRWNRRRVMLVADTGAALLTLLVIALLVIGKLDVQYIYLIALIGAIFATFQELAYTAAVTMLVPEKDLARAGGLMQMGQAVESVTSPLLAGILFVAVGLGGIIAIDLITYFFAVGALLSVSIPQPLPSSETKAQESIWHDVLSGWRYLRARSRLLALTLFFVPVNFLLNFPAVLMVPLILSFQTAAALGIVQTIGGIGMMLGSIVLGVWGGPKHRVSAVIGFVALSALGLFLIGLRPSVIVISVGFFIMLFSVPLVSGLSQAIFQSQVAADIQGRVFAVRTLLSRSMLPIAYLSAGMLADQVFDPLMRPNGILANTFIGSLLSVGPGRGIGLMFVLSAITLVVVCIFAYASSIRFVEKNLTEAREEARLDMIQPN